MSDSAAPTGPDFERGVPAAELRPGVPLLGQVRGEAVVLVRGGAKVYGISASCTHYGGPLAEGRVSNGMVHCPLHHACFDLATGESIGGPALSPITCFEVIDAGGLVRVGAKRPAAARVMASAGPPSVVIVGAGPAGTACAETLRREGYVGPITLLGAEPPGPVDRPNLSKDYLAGTAPEEWMPLRTQEALGEEKIELVVDDPVSRITPAARTVTLTSGRTLSWGALVLALGAEPIVLPIDGAKLPHVHTLRTLADARAIIADLAKAKRAVVLGASFIGLEAAASLRKRGLDVTVVGPEAIPLARILGDEVGRFVRDVHEENGVMFKLGRTPARITSSEVTLSDGSSLPADLVVMGVGVRPRTKLAEEAGLRVDNGVVVDDGFRASLPGVYAVGDVARYPYDGDLVRIEHFAVAERHGQAVARAIAGRGAPYRDVPFFWSQHHDVTLAYVGHAQSFDTPEVHGSLKKRDAIVAYRREGRVRAVLTVGRDRASLDAELALRERDKGDAKAIEALLLA
jgi:NADPH-dependent 2,4-dienoyl-CoA reductase/sulfur reductase-like enzyme/nitrite reductase/ring-hydroxylating ferredoxin subunit